MTFPDNTRVRIGTRTGWTVDPKPLPPGITSQPLVHGHPGHTIVSLDGEPGYVKIINNGDGTLTVEGKGGGAGGERVLVPTSELVPLETKMTNLTAEEFTALSNATSEAEWNRLCREVKAARDGAFPEDWWARMHLSGVMQRVAASWKSK